MNVNAPAKPDIYLDYQKSVYQAGLSGARPILPFPSADLEKQARDFMGPRLDAWIGGGAGSGETIRANREGFGKWVIVQQILHDVATVDLSTNICGTALTHPVMLAPIGAHSILHPEGELAVARAAASVGVPLIASSPSSFTMEEIAAESGTSPHWFQLYWPNDPDLAISFLRRAEEADFGAIVVTLDTPFLGWRPRDLTTAYFPFIQGIGIANYLQDPVFRGQLAKTPEDDLPAAVQHWAALYSNPAVTWENLAFLRDNTRLPILLKGIVDPDDGRRAVDYGMDGIVVSNHGGRQVDGAIGAIEALPGVAEAVEQRIPVLFDSGIRTGADAFKALALGASTVLLGRPYMWGLALAGEAGVKQVLEGLLGELELTFALSGCASLAQATPGRLRRSAP